jgi:subtilase family serine protease
MRASPRTPAAPAAALAAALIAAALTTAGAPVNASAAQAAHPPRQAAHPVPASAGHIDRPARSTPLSTSECLAAIGIHCYAPAQLRQAYDLAPLYAHGVTGKGRTIVIVDSFGSPTVQSDLQTFDKQWGLPDTTVEVVRAGNVPPFDPNNDDMTGWAGETTLDVEWAHAIAPDAHLVLVETPVAETEGVTGFPEMMAAEKTLIDRGVGDVITQSFGATENTFPGFDQGDFSSLRNLRFAFQDAARHGVTVLASSGDDGATDATLDGQSDFPFRVNSWPSSDPLVTSIGGTQLTLDDNGNRLAPDSVWHDDFGAGGGGVSGVFGRPAFQSGVARTVGARRGTPDISMSAAVDGGVWTFESFAPRTAGWHISGGTSAASPMFAGIVALADQVAGHRIGDLHGALYALGAASRLPVVGGRTGIVDVTTKDNSFAGVTGFAAVRGFDLASGWGTIDAARFVPALAFAR